MSRGYRLLIAAIAVITLGVSVGTGAFIGSLYSPDKKQYDAVGSGERASASYQGVTDSLKDISGLPEPVERAIANPQPDSGHDHEKRDLAAQEAMAIWAFWIVVISGATFLVSGVGLWALLKTIWQGQEANDIAIQAREAAEISASLNLAESRKAAKAAQEGADHALSTLKNNRAWITLKEIKADHRPVVSHGQTEIRDGTVFHFIWTNSGNSPARNVVLRKDEKMAPIVGEFSDFKHEKLKPTGKSNLGPGADLTPDGAVIIWSDMEKIKNRESRLLVYNRISYFDVFDPDIERVTELVFDIALKGSTVDKDGRTVPEFWVAISEGQNTMT